MKLITNPIAYLTLSIFALAAAITFTPAVALDQLGVGLLQIIPAAIIGVLLLFAFLVAFGRWRILSKSKDVAEETKASFDKLRTDPIALAIYIGSVALAIAIVINGALS